MTALHLAASSLCGLLTAGAMVPPLLIAAMGIAVRRGHGDPTWNDGEDTWGIPLCLGACCWLVLLSWAALRTTERARGRIAQPWDRLLWALPPLAVTILMACFALS